MTSASFGREKKGRCFQYETGCSANVLDYMDKKCSGNSNCSIFIAESELHKKNPCSKEYSAYLEADYQCVPAATSTECSHVKKLLVTSPDGYLTSREAIDHGYGTTLCPWHIQVKPGQSISLTYFRFGRGKPHTPQLSTCYEIGSVTSRLSSLEGRDDRLTSCGAGTGHRSGTVYTSSGTDITVTFNSREVLRTYYPFIIHYKVDGCPKLLDPPGGYIIQVQKEATIKCNQSEETWFLTCAGNQWNGVRGNCSSKSDSSEYWRSPSPDGADSFPYGILIVVAIGVALGVFIGGLVLSLVYFYMKRKRNPYQEPTLTEQHQQQPPQQQDYYQGTTTLKKQPPHSPGGVLVSHDQYPPITFDDHHDHMCSHGGMPHSHDGYYSTKTQPQFPVQRMYDACASSAKHAGPHLYESTQVS